MDAGRSPSPGKRPSPVGKAARRSLPSHRGRKLPSPVSRNNTSKQEETVKSKENGGEESSEYFDESLSRDTDDSIISASPTSPISPSKVGVAYISENIVKKQAKEENLAQIKSLNLILGKDLNKKFRYLENLENLKQLQVLHVSNHMIEKIEKLDKLTQLRELNLSRNCISKLDGLDCLVRLQVLNVSRNQIQHLPSGLMKKLRELRVFHFAHNQLESLLEITKLRPLQDLTEISMVGNPMSALAHSHQFAIFQLRSLTILDKQMVMEAERVAADDKFGQDEIRRLEVELNRQNNLYDALFEEKHAASTELDKVARLHLQQKDKESQQTQKIKELVRELKAKEDILASKTAELSKACKKQYMLEQELAFYKLDAKFEHLGKIPWPEGEEVFDGPEDESAYIGKAGFKPNAFARESFALNAAKSAELSAIGARLSDKYDGKNQKTLDELHQALIMDLEDKELAVRKAQELLAKLEDDLRRRKNQLKDANKELDDVQKAINEEIQLLEEEDKRLLAAIADKKNYIRQLQDVAAELENRMNKIHDDLRRKENDLMGLQNALNNTSPDDPAYGELQARLAATEQQLRDALQDYDQLKRDYDKAVNTIQAEMAALQKLEDELAARRKAVAEDKTGAQDDLKDVINDLNAHLEAMKTKAAQQQTAIAQLQQDKQALEQRLRDIQDKAGQSEQQRKDNARLQQQLQAAQDALNREKANADGLRRRLSELEGQAAKGSSLEPLLADTKARLKAAEDEMERLRNAVDKLKQQNQADRQAADDRIRKEQEKTDKALQAARAGLDKEREMRDMGTQIDGLKNKNADLEDRIKELEDEVRRSFDKDEVFDRLADLQDDMDHNRDQIRGPLGAGDELAGALGDLHQRYLDLLGALKKEKGDKADKDKIDEEMKGLHGKLENLQNALKQAKQREAMLAKENGMKDAQIGKLGNELQRLQDQLARQGNLEDELARERDAHDHEVAGLEGEIARLKDLLKRAKHAMENALADARGPLEAKIRSLEDKLDKLQDRLARSKADADKLRALHDDHAAEQGKLLAHIAELEDALADAKERAQRSEEKRARDKQRLQGKVKELEDELARDQERLDRLLGNAEDELDRERAANAAKVQDLEDELDRLKDKLRRSQQRADMEEANGARARQLADELAALRDQLDRARLRNSDKLDKADRENAALQALLDEKARQLQNGASRDSSQQAHLRGLQDQIDQLRRMLSDTQGQAMTDKFEKELEALRAEQLRAQAQAAASKELADVQRQIAGLQAMLEKKDKELQGHVTGGLKDASSVAPLRDEIRNLASALAAQNAELERVKADLAYHGRPLTGYSPHPHGPSLLSLAGEVEALHAALQDRERQVQALLHSGNQGTAVFPGHVTATPAAGTTPGLATTGFSTAVPGMVSSGLVTTPGEVHHHHHFKDTGGRRSKSSLGLNRDGAISPTVLGTTVVSPTLSPTSLHHHHYDGLPAERTKRKKKTKRRKSADDLYCNVSQHDDLEYEVGRLEGMLDASTHQSDKAKNQRDSLRLDLRSLENEVEGALRSRASSRQQSHPLDGTLAKFQDHLLTIFDHKSNLAQ